MSARREGLDLIHVTRGSLAPRAALGAAAGASGAAATAATAGGD
jgi:hypothetical protein